MLMLNSKMGVGMGVGMVVDGSARDFGGILMSDGLVGGLLTRC